jgi:hypothetical protein
MFLEIVKQLAREALLETVRVEPEKTFKAVPVSSSRVFLRKQAELIIP